MVSQNNSDTGLTSVFTRCLFCGKNSVPDRPKGAKNEVKV